MGRVLYLGRVNLVRRSSEAFQRRFPRTYLASGWLIFAAFTVWDTVRVWQSPIRETTAFTMGTLIGLGLGLAAAVGWVVTLFRARWSADRFAPWQWATVGLWVVAVVVAHPKGHGGGLPVTNGYIVAALWYEIAAFVGSAVSFAMAVTQGRAPARRRRPIPGRRAGGKRDKTGLLPAPVRASRSA
jgi:hypothetical protein